MRSDSPASAHRRQNLLLNLSEPPHWLVNGLGVAWSRLSEGARAVFLLALDEAWRMNHNYLGTEHVLLGLLRQENGVAAAALQAGRSPSPGHASGLRGLGIEFQMVSAEINRVIGHGTATSPFELTVTPRTTRVVRLAAEESSRRGHAQIGTEHLLIGLLRDGEGIAARVLVDLGADLEAVRAQFEEFWQRDDVIACRISGRAMAAIDRLVEAGVRSTRSEAAAWLIDAGVEAKGDLFHRIGTPIDGMPASRKTQANRRPAVGRPHRRRPSEPT